MKNKISILLVSAVMAVLSVPATVLGFCTDYVEPQYQTAAQALYEVKILQGAPDGSCNLGNNVNRAEFATFAIRYALGGDEDITAGVTVVGNEFTDLGSKTSWYAPIVVKAKEMGIFKESVVRAPEQVNWAEGIVMLLRAIDMEPAVSSSGNWYDNAYKVLRESGINTKDPGVAILRKDMVQLIYDIEDNYYDVQARVEAVGYRKDVDNGTHNNGGTSTYTPPAATPTPAAQTGGRIALKGEVSNQYMINIPNDVNFNKINASAVPTDAVDLITFRQFVENFYELHPAQVAWKLKNLNESEKLTLSIYQAFMGLARYKACLSDTSYSEYVPGDPMLYIPDKVENCATVAQSWAQTAQFVSFGNASDQGESDRGNILIGIKCSTGEFSQGSCGAYMGTMANFNKALESTGQAIVDITSNTCNNPGGYNADGTYCAPRY